MGEQAGDRDQAGIRRLTAALVEWLAIASASAAAACFIVWAASVTTTKADFTMIFPSLYGLSLSDGALEFGDHLHDIYTIEEIEENGVWPSRRPSSRILGLRYRSFRFNHHDYRVVGVSLIYPGMFFGAAAWRLVRSLPRSSPNHSGNGDTTGRKWTGSIKRLSTGRLSTR